jgi:hypothetical protein
LLNISPSSDSASASSKRDSTASVAISVAFFSLLLYQFCFVYSGRVFAGNSVLYKTNQILSSNASKAEMGEERKVVEILKCFLQCQMEDQLFLFDNGHVWIYTWRKGSHHKISLRCFMWSRRSKGRCHL